MLERSNMNPAMRLTLSNRTTRESKNGTISPFAYGDIEEIAVLSQKYFPRSKEVSISYLKETLRDLYFKGVDNHPEITSLVSRSREGFINGFLGVTTQPFFYKKRKLTVANCHHLMATEEARSRLIPMRMLQKFISGPQDLSFSDGSVETMRLFWKRFGGEPSVSESIYYKIPLRPASFVMRPLLKMFNKPLKIIADLSSSGVDNVAGKLRVPMFHRNKPDVELKELTPMLILKGLENLRSDYTLFPFYDERKIEHLFRLLGKEKRYGTFHKLAIIENENVVGWFIYYAKRGDVCEVIQAVCRPGKENMLFNIITWHAYSQGGIELAGRLMTNHMQTPFTTKAVCMPARMWTLIHSSNSELKHDIQAGRAFLTRLEGDLWLI